MADHEELLGVGRDLVAVALARLAAVADAGHRRVALVEHRVLEVVQHVRVWGSGDCCDQGN